MNNVPWWLQVPIGILFIACWIGGTVAVFKATSHHKPWPKFVWRAASAFFPITAFILFATQDRIRRRVPTSAETPALKWIIAHVLLIALSIPAYVIVRHSEIVQVAERHAPDHSQEWWNIHNAGRPPLLCVAMSGGGIRSAAFNIGVLRALNEHGLLAKTDVMSAVSGGSYALSWYLLQHYYARQPNPNGPRLPADRLPNALFDWDGIYQRHLATNARQFRATGSASYYLNAVYSAVYDLSAFNVLRLLSAIGNENLRNVSAAKRSYRESLQATFHLVTQDAPRIVYNEFNVAREGGTLARAQRLSTRAAEHVDLSIADEVTFTDLAKIARQYTLPFPIFVTTVDVDAKDQPGSDDVHPDRLWPSIFEINGWGLGSDSYGYLSWDKINHTDPRFAGVRLVNVTPAISGAAISPAAGGLSIRTQRLLSVANVDLGYTVPRFADEEGSLYLSDGGHAENLGLYPLIRRDCRHIIAIDAEYEAEPTYQFKSYFKAKKALLNDLKRTLQIKTIDTHAFKSTAPVMSGEVVPAGDGAPSETKIYYVKLTKDPNRNYGDPINNAALGPHFPQDPTSNQNFNDLQFRAYRELGYVTAIESTYLKDLAAQVIKP